MKDHGGNQAANRLLGALNWLVEQKPGIYDGLQVPLRSALAADNLQKMGYTNVISMDGGFRGWKDAGHPIQKT